MLFVNLTLDVLAVTAYLGGHADGDVVRVKERGDFGYEGRKFHSGADIGHALAYLHGE